MWLASITVSKQIRLHDKNVKRKQMTHRGYLFDDVSPGCDEPSTKVVLSQRWGQMFLMLLCRGRRDLRNYKRTMVTCDVQI